MVTELESNILECVLQFLLKHNFFLSKVTRISTQDSQIKTHLFAEKV